MFKHRRHSRFIGYLLGLATPLLVAAVMQLTWPFFEKAPVSFFLLAVMVSGWYGGLGPGLVCTSISLLIANYLFIPPYNSLWRPVEGDIVYLVALATVGGLTAVLTGLLHRTRTQAELRLDSFRRVIEEAPNGMVMVDDAGAVVLVNAAIETAFGYAREDLLGQPIEILVPERFRQKHPEYRKTFAAHPTTRAMVPVVTSSREERDIVESYKLGVNAYVVKPVDFNQFMQAIKQIGAFWAVVNQPPPNSGN